MRRVYSTHQQYKWARMMSCEHLEFEVIHTGTRRAKFKCVNCGKVREVPGWYEWHEDTEKKREEPEEEEKDEPAGGVFLPFKKVPWWWF